MTALAAPEAGLTIELWTCDWDGAEGRRAIAGWAEEERDRVAACRSSQGLPRPPDALPPAWFSVMQQRVAP